MRQPRLWRYVLRYDGNFAPHIRGGICSLACCKPMIRRYAARGDWIIGFATRKESRGEAVVRYAMVVTNDPLPLAEYWRSRHGRRDAIYRPDGDGLVWVENEFSDHPDVHGQKRDMSGANALLSTQYWYFDIPGQDLYAALRPQFRSDGECGEAGRRIFFGGRGQKYNGLAPGDFAMIKGWLEGIAAHRSEKGLAPSSQAPVGRKAGRWRTATCTARRQ